MPRYLLLLPAPEQEWENLPPEAHAAGMRAHERFGAVLRAGGHTQILASPLTPSSEALSLRPDGSGGAVVTDGPFSETVEQIAGFYLIETDDPDGLVECCRHLAASGDLIELRKLAGPGDDRAGRP